MIHPITSVHLCTLALAVLASEPVVAQPPDLRTPAPVIYLANNLDEVGQLGWCIDTVGRGLGDRLHAHSCKPQGGDVQFSFNLETGNIASVAFDGFCMAVTPNGETNYGLVNCDKNDQRQQFALDESNGFITHANDRSTCVAVGTTTRSAGPYMSRDLVWADCASGDSRLQTWVIQP